MVRNLTESMCDKLSSRIDSLEGNLVKTIERVVDKKIETAIKKERSVVQRDM